MAETPLFTYVLRLADNALVLGHRLSEWCGHGPILEEDIALSNLALDLVGQARSLYSYAGEMEGRGRDEDKLAYLRDAHDFTNLLICELPKGDFAFTIARQFLYGTYAHLLFQALTASNDPHLAAIAAKSVKEMAYHRRHCAEWLIRLGDGTEKSHDLAQEALDDLWPYSGEMFEVDAAEQALIDKGIAADPRAFKAEWNRIVDDVLAEATLKRPKDGWMQTGGKKGVHTEHLGHMLAPMQHLQRTYPGAVW